MPDTHIIELKISGDLLRRLDERARHQGVDRDGYILEALKKDLEAKEAPTFDALAAPLRQDFKESGMTEADLDDLVETAREAAWTQRNSASRG
jgi:hypothetical protein